MLYLVSCEARYNPNGPGESITAGRIDAIPSDARDLGLVITHEGGFPIGRFIIGSNARFRKPPVIWLSCPNW